MADLLRRVCVTMPETGLCRPDPFKFVFGAMEIPGGGVATLFVFVDAQAPIPYVPETNRAWLELQGWRFRTAPARPTR